MREVKSNFTGLRPPWARPGAALVPRMNGCGLCAESPYDSFKQISSGARGGRRCDLVDARAVGLVVPKLECLNEVGLG